MKQSLVCGAGGFIGSHLVKRLKNEGFWVRGVDLKNPEFSPSVADDFIIGDLRDPLLVQKLFDRDFDEVYQLAADMGGAGYLFIGINDADIMHNSMQINLNILECSRKYGAKRIFFSSSACVYPEQNQKDPQNPKCAEKTVYPASPDSEYGWEKLFSERLYQAYARCYNMVCRIGRYHNIFGQEGTWDGGKEKAPAALCRKIALVEDGGQIEIWGDGEQTRSFLYIDECVEGTIRLMRSDITEPLNIGSEEMISINELIYIISKIAGKRIGTKHIDGPLGVRGRNSDNKLIRKLLGWEPNSKLEDGLRKTYPWVQAEAVKKYMNITVSYD